ncbi:MAG: hypothetical protein PHO80_03705, partial [Candidatus Gracilibacteria bacterium]|nr:hypothetical protein [Candidatus Gracilibacteria bacterium]
MKKIKTISVMTATGQYNIGDELILFEEYKIFKKKFKNASFKIFTYDKNSSLIKDNVEYVTYFPYSIKRHPLKNLYYFWKNIIT